MGKDKNLAAHVCKVHTTYAKTEKEKRDPDEATPSAGDLYEFKPFDANFLRTYIRRARTLEPLIDDAIQKDIVNAYVTIRDEEKKGELDQQDFDEAMRLMKASKESVELSAPAKKSVTPLDLVYDIIADLSRRDDITDGWVDMTHVV